MREQFALPPPSSRAIRPTAEDDNHRLRQALTFWQKSGRV